MESALPHHYDDLIFMSPLSVERADALVSFLSPGLSGTMLDVGCGWGPLLIRAVAAAPEAHGLGLDIDQPSLARARELAASLGVADRTEFRVADVARTGLPEVADLPAAICIGASQAWPREDPDDPRMNYVGALRGLRSVVRRGARVVFAEGIWSRPPTTEAVAALGGREDEMVNLPDLLDLADSQGFAIQAFHEASLEEWDTFESGYNARNTTWLATHGREHPDYAEIRERARSQRDGYLRGYRGVLGLAYLRLRAV